MLVHWTAKTLILSLLRLELLAVDKVDKMNDSSTQLVAALMQTMAQKLLPWPPPPASLAFPLSTGSSGAGNAHAPPGPFYDVALQLANDPLRCLEDLSSQYGSVVGFRLLTRPVVLVADPFFAKEVFITQSSTFIKAGTAFFPNSSLAGNGLLVSDGDSWKRQRRLANPAFRKSAVSTYAKAMVDRTQEMLEKRWSRGGIHDVYADFNDLTTQIVASSLFGGTSGSEDMAEVGPAITTAFEYFTRNASSMMIVPEWVPTPDNLQYLSAVRRLDRVVYSLISERRERLASGTSSTDESNALTAHRDLLTQLLEARDEDGSGMDDQSLRDELMTFLVAGQETSAILLTWALVMLALHPEVQVRLHEECLEILGGQLPTNSNVSKLRYMEAFIWETMRLMPPAYIVGRCANQNTKLGHWDVPAGTTVLVSTYLLHRDPAYWPRAFEFDPQRWLPGGSAIQHMDNDSYWPFGGGPRNCIGMGFAMMEVSLVLATVVREFKVSIPPGGPLPRPRAMITLRPEDEVELLLSKRRAPVHHGR